MILLWLPIGLLLPTLIGWLLLRLLEARTPVLFSVERWVMGFVFGLTVTMFAAFCANVCHLLPFTRWGFASVQVALVLPLALARLLQWKFSPSQLPATSYKLPASHPSLWLKGTLLLAVVWTLFKVVSGTAILATTPSYFDDTLKNWNERAKIFVMTGTLDTSASTVSPLSSYPPAVSLTKAWLTTLAGRWNDGLVNSIHALWFLSALSLLFFALRRRVAWTWSLFGSLLLSSLPLYFFHGVNAYADVFVSVHLFAAVSLLWSGLIEKDNAQRSSFLRLSALASALLIFTKNEALLLHLPLVLALLVAGLFSLRRSRGLSNREAAKTLLWFAGWILAIGLPWLIFKWVHGLTFGNAKAVSGIVIGWQPGVLWTLGVNIFFEGNWHLLFPVLLLLLITRGRSALKSSFAPLLLFVIAALALQLLLFLFTPLSVEAIRQTGIGRGFVQLAPLMVILVTLWVREIFTEE